jgi:hypothetical protein
LFRFNTLPGDVNQDGEVRRTDLLDNLLHQFTSFPGSAAYEELHDVNADRVINVRDAQLIQLYNNESLPSGEPAPAPPAAAPAAAGDVDGTAADRATADRPFGALPAARRVLAPRPARIQHPQETSRRATDAALAELAAAARPTLTALRAARASRTDWQRRES